MSEGNATDTNKKVTYLKTVAVGDGCAGKTCMLIVYARKQFPEMYVPTVFDCEVVESDIDSENTVKFGLWDTGGGEDYHRLRPLSYPDTNVFILCYDVSNRDSFDNLVDYWYAELRHHCPDVPIVLVGAKTDLRESKSNCVTRKEGEKLAKKTNSHYAEICSLRLQGVDELFEKVARIGFDYHTGVESTEKKSRCIIL